MTKPKNDNEIVDARKRNMKARMLRKQREKYADRLDFDTIIEEIEASHEALRTKKPSPADIQKHRVLLDSNHKLLNKKLPNPQFIEFNDVTDVSLVVDPDDANTISNPNKSN